MGMRRINFLDPAFGTGAFYSSLLRSAGAKRVERSLGFEIDPHYGTPAASLWKKRRVELRITDFTQADAPKEFGEKFNLADLQSSIRSPPPFGRQEKGPTFFKGCFKCRHSTERVDGTLCYFLLLCDAWMQPGGISVWLIPSEFMDVNYGARIKALPAYESFPPSNTPI